MIVTLLIVGGLYEGCSSRIVYIVFWSSFRSCRFPEGALANGSVRQRLPHQLRQPERFLQADVPELV
jgi:hypothetical protein